MLHRNDVTSFIAYQNAGAELNSELLRVWCDDGVVGNKEVTTAFGACAAPARLLASAFLRNGPADTSVCAQAAFDEHVTPERYCRDPGHFLLDFRQLDWDTSVVDENKWTEALTHRIPHGCGWVSDYEDARLHLSKRIATICQRDPVLIADLNRRARATRDSDDWPTACAAAEVLCQARPDTPLHAQYQQTAAALLRDNDLAPSRHNQRELAYACTEGPGMPAAVAYYRDPVDWVIEDRLLARTDTSPLQTWHLLRAAQTDPWGNVAAAALIHADQHRPTARDPVANSIARLVDAGAYIDGGDALEIPLTGNPDLILAGTVAERRIDKRGGYPEYERLMRASHLPPEKTASTARIAHARCESHDQGGTPFDQAWAIAHGHPPSDVRTAADIDLGNPGVTTILARYPQGFVRHLGTDAIVDHLATAELPPADRDRILTALFAEDT